MRGAGEAAVVGAAGLWCADQLPGVADRTEFGRVAAVVRMGAAGGLAPGRLQGSLVRVEGDAEDFIGRTLGARLVLGTVARAVVGHGAPFG